MPKNMIAPLEKFFFKEEFAVSDQNFSDEQRENWLLILVIVNVLILYREVSVNTLIYRQ